MTMPIMIFCSFPHYGNTENDPISCQMCYHHKNHGEKTVKGVNFGSDGEDIVNFDMSDSVFSP